MISILVMGFLLLIVTLTIVACFGSITLELSFPFLSLARYVNIEDVFERMDVLIIILWVSAIFLKIVIFLYCSLSTAQIVFKAKTKKWFILPFSLVVFTLTEVIWPNSQVLKEVILTKYSIYYTIVQVAIPIKLYIIATIKERVFKNVQ